MASDALTKLITKVNAVIHFDGAGRITLHKAQTALRDEYLNVECDLYGMIIHDRDVLDDGKLKVPHIHLVFRLKKRKRKSTVINELAKCVGVGTLAVSVESYTSFEGSFQYLIHKNDPNKTQYNRDDIVTNLAEGEVDTVMDAKAVTLDLRELRAFCKANDDIIDLIEFVGLSTYQHYRATILDVFNYYRALRMEENVKKGHNRPF